MKITFKIAPDILFFIQKMALKRTQQVTKSSLDKFNLSLVKELFEILSKKCISYTSNHNGKDQKISLKYHTAYVLLQILLEEIKCNYLPPYEQNKLEILKNELHQKLL